MTIFVFGPQGVIEQVSATTFYFILKVDFPNLKVHFQQTEYARSVDSGAGSLSPTSNQSSPTSTPLHGHITVSIQPQKPQRTTTRQKVSFVLNNIFSLLPNFKFWKGV